MPKSESATKKSSSKPAQAAIEYLISYGWAILIIAVVLSFVYFYVLSQSTSTPSTCSFSSGVTCEDIVLSANSVTGNGIITLFLINIQQYAIRNPQLIANINGVNTSASSCTPLFVLPGGSIICTLNIPFYAPKGQLFLGGLYLKAQYCGLNVTYLNTKKCGYAPTQTYQGTFSAHAQQKIGSLTPSITLSAVNATQIANGALDPIVANVYLGGIQIKGAVVFFTENNLVYALRPSYSETNSSGSALGYISGTVSGQVTVTANYSNNLANVVITFTQPSVTFSAGNPSPSSPTIDNGQSITLSPNPSGGTAPLSYHWYYSSTSTCNSGSTSLAITKTISASMNDYYCYTVTDSETTPVTKTSAADQVTVNAALLAGAITPSSPSISSGQHQTLTSNPSGGTTPYSYVWYTSSAGNPSCNSANTILGSSNTLSTITVSPTTTNSYTYQVKDSAYSPQSVCSASDTVSISNLAVTLSPSSNTIYAGQSNTITATPSGGSGTYSTYQWLGTTAGGSTFSASQANSLCGIGTSAGEAQSSTCTFATNVLTTNGIYSFNVIVTDSASHTAQASPASAVTVNVPYVPITLTNNQGSSTGSSFQEQLFINSNNYVSGCGTSSYCINSQWSNVEFTTGPSGTGTLLYAWVENNAVTTSVNTIVWVNLGSGINLGTTSPSNSVTIYMNFMPTNIMSSTSSYTGEAPQIEGSVACSTYGECDNAANVFTKYWDFAGSTLPAQFSTSDSAGKTVNNGLTITAGSVYSSSTAFSSLNSILEGDIALTSSTATAYTGISQASSQAPLGGNTGDAAEILYITNSNTNNNYLDFSSNGGSGYNCQNAGTLFTPSTNVYYVIGSIVTSTSVIETENYASLATVACASNTNQYIILGYFEGSSSSTTAITPTSIQWLRVRTYPPNGVMPIQAYGSII